MNKKELIKKDKYITVKIWRKSLKYLRILAAFREKTLSETCHDIIMVEYNKLPIKKSHV